MNIRFTCAPWTTYLGVRPTVEAYHIKLLKRFKRSFLIMPCLFTGGMYNVTFWSTFQPLLQQLQLWALQAFSVQKWNIGREPVPIPWAYAKHITTKTMLGSMPKNGGDMSIPELPIVDIVWPIDCPLFCNTNRTWFSITPGQAIVPS